MLISHAITIVGKGRHGKSSELFSAENHIMSRFVKDL